MTGRRLTSEYSFPTNTLSDYDISYRSKVNTLKHPPKFVIKMNMPMSITGAAEYK